VQGGWSGLQIDGEGTRWEFRRWEIVGVGRQNFWLMEESVCVLKKKKKKKIWRACGCKGEQSLMVVLVVEEGKDGTKEGRRRRRRWLSS
jgi:hypothetical protein